MVIQKLTTTQMFSHTAIVLTVPVAFSTHRHEQNCDWYTPSVNHLWSALLGRDWSNILYKADRTLSIPHPIATPPRLKAQWTVWIPHVPISRACFGYYIFVVLWWYQGTSILHKVHLMISKNSIISKINLSQSPFLLTFFWYTFDEQWMFINQK